MSEYLESVDRALDSFFDVWYVWAILLSLAGIAEYYYRRNHR